MLARLHASLTWLERIVLGDPEADVERQLRQEASVLQQATTALVDGSITTVASVAFAFMLGWCIPSTYAIKKKYLRYVSTSPLLRRVESAVPYLLLFAAIVWMKEYRKASVLHANAARLREVLQRRGSRSNDGEAAQTAQLTQDALATSDALVANTIRKYRAGCSIGCAKIWLGLTWMCLLCV